MSTINGEAVAVHVESAAVQQFREPEGGVYALASLTDEQFNARLAVMVKGRERVQQIQRAAMREDVHFGVIPGTKKPSLLKPGAELLCQMYRLVPEFRVNTTFGDGVDGPHVNVHADCLLHVGDLSGVVAGTGVGNCNSWERKYRYRDAQRKCPACGAEALFYSKEAKYGQFRGKPSYWCSPKKAGCGENFAGNDPRIANQVAGTVDNPDPYDLANTLEKMACKRAYVDATLRATATSDLFTQDVEDLPQHQQQEVAPRQNVTARPAAAAVKRDAQVRATASASVAEVLNNSGAPMDESEVGTEAAPAMSDSDRAEVLAQCPLDEVLLRLAAMRAATKGERKFYELHQSDTGAQRASIVDAELLLSFRKEPVNTWLDQIKNNSMAWGSFCRAIVKLSDSLGIGVTA